MRLPISFGGGTVDTSSLRQKLGLGTAAAVDVGTAPGNAVALDENGALPAIDAGKLLNVPAPAVVVPDGSLSFAKLASATIAVATDIFVSVTGKLVSVSALWAAQTPTVLADASTIAVDLDAGLNFAVTLGGNRTLAAPTNLLRGQSGVIEITQDGAGNRTLDFAAGWDFGAAGKPTLSTLPGKIDLISYYVLNTTGPIVRAFFSKAA